MSTPARTYSSDFVSRFKLWNREHTLWSIDFSSSSDYEDADRHQVVNWKDANALSSLCNDGLHRVVVDIDRPAMLIASKTEGHWHLYIKKRLSWRQYKKLLKALMKAGIIEKGYYKASRKRKATFLRLPPAAELNPWE